MEIFNLKGLADNTWHDISKSSIKQKVLNAHLIHIFQETSEAFCLQKIVAFYVLKNSIFIVLFLISDVPFVPSKPVSNLPLKQWKFFTPKMKEHCDWFFLSKSCFMLEQ